MPKAYPAINKQFNTNQQIINVYFFNNTVYFFDRDILTNLYTKNYAKFNFIFCSPFNFRIFAYH